MSTASDCLQRVERTVGGVSMPGLYVDVPRVAIFHPLNYYFRRLRPWTRAEAPSPEGLGMSRPGPLVVGQTVIDVGFHHDIILRAAAASKLPVGVLSRG